MEKPSQRLLDTRRETSLWAEIAFHLPNPTLASGTYHMTYQIL